MSVALGNPVRRIGEFNPFREMGSMPDLSISELASLKEEPKAQELTTVKCSQAGCETTIEVPFWCRFSCACDPCREKYAARELREKVNGYWSHICPPAFLDTREDHPSYPHAQANELKEWRGEESLLFYGPSGAGKTRLAMQMLFKCLLERTTMVGVLWPEQLKSVKYSHDQLILTEKWGRYDVLLMDDALLTGAQDERITDWLKTLIDYRQRYKRHHIITSQIGGDDYEAQAEKFGEQTKADKERIKALLRRIREQSRVIPFVPAVPGPGESAY